MVMVIKRKRRIEPKNRKNKEQTQRRKNKIVFFFILFAKRKKSTHQKHTQFTQIHKHMSKNKIRNKKKKKTLSSLYYLAFLRFRLSLLFSYTTQNTRKKKENQTKSSYIGTVNFPISMCKCARGLVLCLPINSCVYETKLLLLLFVFLGQF